MPTTTYDKSKIVLLETTVQKTFAAPARLPDNLHDYLEAAGVFTGIASVFFLPASVALGGALPLDMIWALPLSVAMGAVQAGVWTLKGTGSFDQIQSGLEPLRNRFAGLHYTDYPGDPVHTAIDIDVVVLQRDDGSLDIALRSSVCYATRYNILPIKDGDDATMRSLYHDWAVFGVLPQSRDLALNLKSVSPQNEINVASYSYTNTWSVGAGFSGEIAAAKDPGANLGFNANGSYTFAGTATWDCPDFSITKNTEVGQGVVWESRMRNVYEDGRPLQYDWKNPNSIVSHSPFTTWLKGVPDAARNDLDHEFLCSFRVSPSDVGDGVIKLDFFAMQQLQHAVVMGRWGAPNARVGGAPAVIPGFLEASATLVIDLNAKRASITNDKVAFKTLLEKASGIQDFRDRPDARKVSVAGYNYPNHFLRHRSYLGYLTPVTSDLDRQDASFLLVTDPQKSGRVAFEARNVADHYLRHEGFRLKLAKRTGDALFEQDSRFDMVPGLADPSGVSFRSVNFPDRYLRHRNFELYLDPLANADSAFKEDATFRLVDPLTK